MSLCFSELYTETLDAANQIIRPATVINYYLKCWIWDSCLSELILTTLHLLAEFTHVVRSYGSQELNVVVTVIFGHLLCCGFVWSLTRDRQSRISTTLNKSFPDQMLSINLAVTNVRRFPFSCTVRSWEADCGSSGCDVVSWDVLVRNSNFRCHLQRKHKFLFHSQHFLHYINEEPSIVAIPLLNMYFMQEILTHYYYHHLSR